MVLLNRRVRVTPGTQDGNPPQVDAIRLGAIVRTLRERLGIRQKDLAKIARVAPNTVSGLEAGRRTQPINVDKIATALGTTAEALRRGDYADAESIVRELNPEAIDVARQYMQAPTSVRTGVVALLRTGRRDIADRFAKLDPERQATVINVLRAEERDQDRADAIDRERFAESTGNKPYGA